MRPTSKGFTLIELMIVVVIAGILAAIAYPSYLNQVRDSRRADAQTAAMDIASREERFFTEYGQYTGTVVAPSSCSGAACGLNLGSDMSEANFYKLSVNAPGATPTTYTITATAQGDQTNDDCGNLTLTNAGVKGVSSSEPVSECWY